MGFLLKLYSSYRFSNIWDFKIFSVVEDDLLVWFKHKACACIYVITPCWSVGVFVHVVHRRQFWFRVLKTNFSISHFTSHYDTSVVVIANNYPFNETFFTLRFVCRIAKWFKQNVFGFLIGIFWKFKKSFFFFFNFCLTPDLSGTSPHTRNSRDSQIFITFEIKK